MTGTSFHDQEPERPYTHLRIVAVEATAMATPEVVGLARADLLIDKCGRFVVQAPRAIRRSSAADEGSPTPRACTPADLGYLVWGTGTPQVLVGHGAAVWDHLPPAISRSLPRIDMARVARLVWPGAPGYGCAELVAWLGLEPAVLVPPQGSPEAPARMVLETAALLVTAAFVEMGSWRVHSRPVAASLFGDLAGDPVLQAMVDISAVPAPPIDPVPSPADGRAAWHRLGGSDLAWITADPAASVFARATAQGELHRRAIRDAGPVTPGTLLRRTGPLSRR